MSHDSDKTASDKPGTIHYIEDAKNGHHKTHVLLPLRIFLWP